MAETAQHPSTHQLTTLTVLPPGTPSSKLPEDVAGQEQVDGQLAGASPPLKDVDKKDGGEIDDDKDVKETFHDVADIIIDVCSTGQPDAATQLIRESLTATTAHSTSSTTSTTDDEESPITPDILSSQLRLRRRSRESNQALMKLVTTLIQKRIEFIASIGRHLRKAFTKPIASPRRNVYEKLVYVHDLIKLRRYRNLLVVVMERITFNVGEKRAADKDEGGDYGEGQGRRKKVRFSDADQIKVFNREIAMLEAHG